MGQSSRRVDAGIGSSSFQEPARLFWFMDDSVLHLRAVRSRRNGLHWGLAVVDYLGLQLCLHQPPLDGAFGVSRLASRSADDRRRAAKQQTCVLTGCPTTAVLISDHGHMSGNGLTKRAVTEVSLP